jgi:nucleoside-diphosphate-sugar epimerase
MKAIVSGASGFIGHHLVRALLAQGDEVRALIRNPSAAEELRTLGADAVLGDVTQSETLGSAVTGMDVVYHLAGLVKALSYQALLKVNEGGVRLMAEACAAQPSPPVLVLASSLAAGGPSLGDRPRTELDPPHPISNYGRSKRLGELAAELWADKVPITVLRPPFVFGEGDANTLQIFRPIASTGFYAVPGELSSKLSVVHADDLAKALMLAAAHGARLKKNQHDSSDGCQGYYYVAAEEDLSYDELGRLIGHSLGRTHVSIVHTPRWVGWCLAAGSELRAFVRHEPTIFGLDKMREVTAGSWTCSAERISTDLGFRVGKSLADRLRQTSAWYARHGWL